MGGRQRKGSGAKTASMRNAAQALTPRIDERIRGAASAPKSDGEDRFRWSAQAIDYTYEGRWDWNLQPKESADLLRLLETLEELTWNEVRTMRVPSKDQKSRMRHHEQDVDGLSKDAQARLRALQIDVDALFRLRLDGMTRVWGYKMGPVLHLVWFDRDHQVYPVGTS